MLRNPPEKKEPASAKGVPMFEQNARDRDHKARPASANAREVRGRKESGAGEGRLLRQDDFQNELRQSIDATLFWYDYLSRFRGNQAGAVGARLRICSKSQDK